MDKWSEYLENEDSLPRIYTLVIGLIVIAGVCFAADGFFKELIVIGWIRLIIYFLLISSWVGFWSFKHFQLPKNRDKNKIGIILSIETESVKQKTRLKSDLFKRIIEQVDKNNLNEIINVVLASNFQAEKINPFLNKHRNAIIKAENTNIPIKLSDKLNKQWFKFQKRTNGHLFIWGRIRERQNNDPTYFIETHILVVHWELELKFKNQLSDDLKSVWSPLVSFLEKAEFEGFNVSADYFYVVAKYIIGIVAFIHGDNDVAFNLHKNILNEIQILSSHPSFPRIEKRIRELLAEEYAILAGKS